MRKRRCGGILSRVMGMRGRERMIAKMSVEGKMKGKEWM